MSTVIDSDATTVAARGAAATRALCDALELGALKPADLKFLTIALAEVAASESRRNSSFARQIRDLYVEIKPQKPVKKPSSRNRTSKGFDELTPIGVVDPALLDPYAPPNPWALQTLYGQHQLQRALERYSLSKLKEALILVQERYPGKKPASMTKKGIVTFIVQLLDSAA